METYTVLVGDADMARREAEADLLAGLREGRYSARGLLGAPIGVPQAIPPAFWMKCVLDIPADHAYVGRRRSPVAAFYGIEVCEAIDTQAQVTVDARQTLPSAAKRDTTAATKALQEKTAQVDDAVRRLMPTKAWAAARTWKAKAALVDKTLNADAPPGQSRKPVSKSTVQRAVERVAGEAPSRSTV